MTHALDPTGSTRSLRVDSEGKLLVTGIAGGGGGGGGTGDASAANQLTQIARLDTLVSQTDGVETALALLATSAQLASLLTQATNFRPVLNSTQSLAVTATSSAAQAVTAGDVLRFSNAGTKPIAVGFGTSGVAAVYASALDIMPGSSEAITVPAGATHFAAICNTGDTGTLKWTRGTGL